MKLKVAMVTDKKIYNYITTNTKNGLQYIGTHCTANKNDGYYGSGILLRKAIKKYGKGLFIKTILCECNTLEEAFTNEEKYIKEYYTLHPNGYNVSPTGGKMKVGFRTRESIDKSNQKRSGKNNWQYGKTRTKEHGENLSKALKGRVISEETKAKMSEAKRNVSEETRKKYSEAAKNRKHTPESIEKMRNSKKGKKLTCEHKAKLKEARNKRPLFSDKTKKKMSESHKGFKHTEESKAKMRIAQAVRREREKEAALEGTASHKK